MQFKPTQHWQDVPDDAVLPPGCHVRMNLTTGRQQVRLSNGLHDEDEGAPAPPAEPQSVHRAPPGFRLPPNNVEAEQALLGAILINNDAYREVAEFLAPEHFYEPVHARVYAAICRLISDGRHADHVLLRAAFDDDPDLRKLDGARYLANLARAAECVINAGDYGREIHGLAVRRNIIALAEELQNRAYDTTLPETTGQEIEHVRKRIDEIARGIPGRSFPPLPEVDHADLDQELKPPDFLVDRWIPLGCLTSLYGSGGAGKSFIALMLAMCVAAGRVWLQHRTMRASVLAVLCEDDDLEIRRRRNKIAKALGITRDDLGDRLHLIPRVGEPNALMEFPQSVATRTAFFEHVLSECQRLQPLLVILDNAAQLFAGNENDRAQVTAFLNAITGIAVVVKGSVLLLGHPPKLPNVEYSGSTAWDAVPRCRLMFKRLQEEDDVPNGPRRYTLELAKTNRDKSGYIIELHENQHGVVEFVGEYVPPEKDGRLRQGSDTHTLLRIVNRAGEKGIELGAARSRFILDTGSSGETGGTKFRTAKDRLIKKGLITPDGDLLKPVG